MEKLSSKRFRLKESSDACAQISVKLPNFNLNCRQSCCSRCHCSLLQQLPYTISNFEIPLRHIKKYKDINLSIWCQNIFHPPFWVPFHLRVAFTTSSPMPSSPFCTALWKIYSSYNIKFYCHLWQQKTTSRGEWERRREKPFDHLIHLILSVMEEWTLRWRYW
jgi:hypothetical protein